MSKLKKEYIRTIKTSMYNRGVVVIDEHAVAFTNHIMNALSDFSDKEIEIVLNQKHYTDIVNNNALSMEEQIETIKSLPSKIVKKNILVDLRISTYVQNNSEMFETSLI